MGIDKKIIIARLKEKGLIKDKPVQFKPLPGGVSSDIFLLHTESGRYVVKQARKKLKVEDDWYADKSRNKTEQDFISYLQTFRPASVPKIICSCDRYGFFIMDYVDDTYVNWKQQLMQGNFEKATALKAAGLLSEIHLQSYKDSGAENRFQTTENFKSLRIEPYLTTTGDRHPALKKIFYEEAERLENWREALVHGDYSPKNIMVRNDGIILLDHEVAWFGDPSFDIAFLLNHLYLKKLYVHDRGGSYPDLILPAWDRYQKKMGTDKMQSIEPRTGKLLLMLMLARIDGKSPVMYLSDKHKDFTRNFVYKLLQAAVYDQSEIHTNWNIKLNSL